MKTEAFRHGGARPPGICRADRGFSLVSAIFLLVVLGALGAAMTNIATVQHASSAMDIEGMRAYQAARAGIEWGLYQGKANPAGCPAGSFSPPAPTLSRYTVTVACVNTSTAVNATNTIQVRQLTATACNSPAAGACPNGTRGANYIQRVLQVTF